MEINNDILTILIVATSAMAITILLFLLSHLKKDDYNKGKKEYKILSKKSENITKKPSINAYAVKKEDSYENTLSENINDIHNEILRKIEKEKRITEEIINDVYKYYSDIPKHSDTKKEQLLKILKTILESGKMFPMDIELFFGNVEDRNRDIAKDIKAIINNSENPIEQEINALKNKIASLEKEIHLVKIESKILELKAKNSSAYQYSEKINVKNIAKMNVSYLTKMLPMIEKIYSEIYINNGDYMESIKIQLKKMRGK